MSYQNALYYAIIGALFCFFTQNTQAQELIPDPSFELWDGTTGTPPFTLDPLTHWYNVNGTPDHHHQLNPPGSNLTSLEPCPTGMGQNQCGVPYEGQAVLGCYKGNGADGTKEWAAVQLTEPMIAGACYTVSFWIQSKKDNPDFLMETNQWGVFFSHTEYPTFNADLTDFSTMADHWVACEEVIVGGEWQYVELPYVASEDFVYAYVGYMGNMADATFTAWSASFSIGFYAWYDMVSVKRIEPTLTVDEDVTICEGDSILLTALSNFPVTWDEGVSLNNEIWVQPMQNTTYYVQTLDSTACSLMDSVVVTVIEKPVVNYMENVCVGAAPFILEPAINGGIWNGLGIVDPATSLFDPSISGSGIVEIEFIVDGDCSENFTLLVTVDEAPPVDFEADVLEGCPLLVVAFTDLSPMPSTSYLWDFGNGDITSTDNSTEYHEAGSFDVSLSVTFSAHCSTTLVQEDLIQVYEMPLADFEVSTPTPVAQSPVQFDNTSSTNVVEWLWDFGDGSTSTEPSPSHTFATAGDYAVNLTVTTADACSATTTQNLTIGELPEVIVEPPVNHPILIPTAFSPNDDGINDYFGILGGEVVNIDWQIFNRWGQKIYATTTLGDKWDGMIDRKAAETGVYVYTLRVMYADGTVENFKGNVTLVR